MSDERDTQSLSVRLEFDPYEHSPDEILMYLRENPCIDAMEVLEQ